MFEPRAVTRCANGDVFIADNGNQRVRRIAAATGTITSVLGDGIAASSGDGAPASSFPVGPPLGLPCDAIGNLFVTEFLASVTSCLTGLVIVDATHLQVTDACTGLLLELTRAPLE